MNYKTKGLAKRKQQKDQHMGAKFYVSGLILLTKHIIRTIANLLSN